MAEPVETDDCHESGKRQRATIPVGRKPDPDFVPPPPVKFAEDLFKSLTSDYEAAVKFDEEAENEGREGKKVEEFKELTTSLQKDGTLTQYIPIDELGNQTSIGSIMHGKAPIGSECRPCVFFINKRCLQRELCFRCHLYHPDMKPRKPRPSAKKRATERDRRGARAKDGAHAAHVAVQTNLTGKSQNSGWTPQLHHNKPGVSIPISPILSNQPASQVPFAPNIGPKQLRQPPVAHHLVVSYSSLNKAKDEPTDSKGDHVLWASSDSSNLSLSNKSHTTELSDDWMRNAGAQASRKTQVSRKGQNLQSRGSGYETTASTGKSSKLSKDDSAGGRESDSPYPFQSSGSLISL